MSIEEVANIIGRIAGGIEEACLKCLEENSGIIIIAITEQLYSGVNGDGDYLRPTYDDDDFFNEKGFWYQRSKDYKAWKKIITPPLIGSILGLNPRPDEVPNLCIDGTFYSEINARRNGDSLLIDPGGGNGPVIVEKYGNEILMLGSTAVEFFNEEYMLPAIGDFFKDCGYK